MRPETVRRVGVRAQRFADLYHFLLTTSWPRFFALVTFAYVAVNALFAGLYLLDRDALDGATGRDGLRSTRSSSRSRPWPPSATEK